MSTEMGRAGAGAGATAAHECFLEKNEMHHFSFRIDG